MSYSWLLTYISNYIKKNNDKYIVYEEKVKMLEEIKINYPNMSNNLYERIQRYLRYNKSKYKYNIKYVLDSLPPSIQNNLIVEIYKPIIKNFLFFKYFENSDFFVKIVTSMKPILSIKDDILVHEGDIIEDIIFIKKGILSLQADIYLNSSKNNLDENIKFSNNSISNRVDSLSYFRSINHTKNEEKNYNYSYLNSVPKNTIKLEKNKCQKKQIKIIELRNNEHFGDVLMILNEKSPVTIKVKSKKAELLFLQKTDATEISYSYPNIWKRIVIKSLYNLNKIKNIINKKVILYCQLNDMLINEEFKKLGNNEEIKFNISEKNAIKKKNDNIKSIIKEVDESKYLSPENSNISKSKKNLFKKFFSFHKCKKENKNNFLYFNNKREKSNCSNIANSEKIIKNNKTNDKLDLNKNKKSLFFEEDKNNIEREKM